MTSFGSGLVWVLLNISIFCHVLITIIIKGADTTMLNLFVWCKELLAGVCPGDPLRNPPPSTPYILWLRPHGTTAISTVCQSGWSTRAVAHTFHTYLCCLERERERNQTRFIHWLFLKILRSYSRKKCSFKSILAHFSILELTLSILIS